MKLLLILSCILIQTASAALPYEWNKDIGNNRFERGIEDQVVLTTIKDHGIFRLAKSCNEDELLISGGCGSAYGLNVTNNFPFTSRVKGSRTEWVCTGRPDFDTALTIDGNYQTPETPKDQLVGDFMVVVVCEKIK